MTDLPDPSTVTSVPNAEGTPRRSVRVPDPLWLDAKRAAEYNGETLTEVIQEFLDDYVRRTRRQQERRRDRGRD